MKLEQIIIESVREIFATMVLMEVAPEKPLTEKVSSFSDHASGLLGISGDLKGLVGIHCPLPTAGAITASLLGIPADEANEDVKDAMGEMANMIAGGIKTALEAEGKNLELAIPSTIAGRAYTLDGLSRADWIMVPFVAPEGRFLAELKYLTTP
ncbi:MAG: chemotaxis protein CheX [Desulfuromonas sp.]|uniref:chemotaxis protein CheX n=1 Tax=Desulfuromonas sp. TaxID=892 RepID=UPI000CB8573C|nr:chemotaxis protein CheX [Desulfuromonas sp.]PLX84977.1 MAG: chemotaxis protein CheX [Desulfuromonas sp.]